MDFRYKKAYERTIHRLIRTDVTILFFFESEHDGDAAFLGLFGKAVGHRYFHEDFQLLAGFKFKVPLPLKIVIFIIIKDLTIAVDDTEFDRAKVICATDTDAVFGIGIECFIQFGFLTFQKYGGMVIPVMLVGGQTDFTGILGELLALGICPEGSEKEDEEYDADKQTSFHNEDI